MRALHREARLNAGQSHLIFFVVGFARELGGAPHPWSGSTDRLRRYEAGRARARARARSGLTLGSTGRQCDLLRQTFSQRSLAHGRRLRRARGFVRTVHAAALKRSAAL